MRMPSRARLFVVATAVLAMVTATVAVTPSPAVAAPVSGSGALVYKGLISLTNFHSQLCVDNPDRSKTKGAVLDQEGCNLNDWQRWEVWQDGLWTGGDLVVELINEHSNMCLADPSASPVSRQLILWPCNNGLEQRWRITSSNCHTYPAGGTSCYEMHVINVSSGLYMAVGGGSTSPGGRVIQWPANGGSEQLWECGEELLFGWCATYA